MNQSICNMLKEMSFFPLKNNWEFLSEKFTKWEKAPISKGQSRGLSTHSLVALYSGTSPIMSNHRFAVACCFAGLIPTTSYCKSRKEKKWGALNGLDSTAEQIFGRENNLLIHLIRTRLYLAELALQHQQYCNWPANKLWVLEALKTFYSTTPPRHWLYVPFAFFMMEGFSKCFMGLCQGIKNKTIKSYFRFLLDKVKVWTFHFQEIRLELQIARE